MIFWFIKADPEFDWVEKNFSSEHRYVLTVDRETLKPLQICLTQNRDFLLRLLENPNLQEHEAFSDLLLAIFHLTDELIHRKDIEEWSMNDFNHMQSDLTRVYHLIVKEWLNYIHHIKEDYPYLFTLAIKMSPFDVLPSSK